MLWRNFHANCLWYLVPALLCGLILGCGDSKTVRVSGKVTFKGQPVPAGKVYFIPDSSKGNTGPTGYSNIKDGQYDTSSTGGKGATPGAVIIAVEGIDPNVKPDKADSEVTAKLLFSRYELTAELPKSSTTKDIEVPAEAEKGPAPPKGGPAVVP